MNQNTDISRRSFLKSGASALVLAVSLPALGVPASGAETQGQLSAFIKVLQSGMVELTVPAMEIGQGSHTSLAMILADELGVDWPQVIVIGPTLNAEMNTPGRTVQNTSGSQMVRRWNEPLRIAAAKARAMLTQAAAERWKVEAAECTVESGAVIHNGERLGFGELVSDASKLTVPEAPEVLNTMKLVGTSVPRVDIPAKVQGKALYGTDVRVPGMVYAAVRQAPVYGARLVSFDEASAGSGLLGFAQTADAVIVIADTFWKAKSAVEKMTVEFSETENDAVTSDDIFAAQKRGLDGGEFATPIAEGDAASAIERAKAEDRGLFVEADYTVQFLHHATMEPMTCTAHVEGGRCEIWVPTQNITATAGAASKITGIPVENIKVNVTYAGGAFGRKFETDFVDQAVTAAMTAGKPVQLIWTREEDVQHGFYRPAMSARLSVGVGEDGAIDGIVMKVAGPSVLEHTIGKALIDGSDPVAWIGFSTETGVAPGKLQQYSIGNVTTQFAFVPTHVPVGYWRSVGASQNHFFIESMIDEIATALKVDPVEYRRRLLSESPRALAVLDRVAIESGWVDTPDPGRFRGVAFTDCVGSMVGQVVELSMDGDRPVVHRVTAVVDCGTAVNPDSVDAQMRGAIIMGLGAAISENVTISEGRCVQSNFHDYRVSLFAETPQIDVHIINSGHPIGGVGETGLPGVAPALCNAIFAATGVRHRQLPLVGA